MPLLRVPLSSPWTCQRCGYPLRSLARSGECPECGWRVTASIVQAQTRERDEAAAASVIRAEWIRGRWKWTVVGLSGLVGLLGIGRSIYAGGDPATMAKLLVVFVVGSALATSVSLLITARLGFLSARSQLSLVTLALAGAAAGSALGTTLVMLGLPSFALPLGIVALLAVVCQEVELDGFAVVAIIGSHLLLVSVVGLFA